MNIASVTDEDLGTISSSALNQYLVSAEQTGLDVRNALQAVGMDQDAVADPDARFPGKQFEQLLIQLIDASADPLFGLHTSEHIQPGSYSVMGYIAMSASTIMEALSRVALYEKLVGDMGTTETQIDNGRVMVKWNCRHHTQPARRHLIENVLASWVKYTRWLANNEDLNPDCVLLEHPAPGEQKQLLEYQRIFRCEVRFRQPCNALIANPNLLQHPLRQPDPHLLSTLEAHAASKLSQLGIETTLSQKVRDLIRKTIESRLPRKEQIAEELGMNIRTLHRKLQDENTSWQEILDSLRQELAMNYLRNTDLPQAEIADKLGFSDIRSFQRAFKRQNDSTPGEYRSRHQRNR